MQERERWQKTMKLQAKLMFPCKSCDQWQNPTFCLTSYEATVEMLILFVGNYKRILEEKPKWKVGVEICFRFFISRPSEKWWVGASDRIDQVPRCPNIFFISVKKPDDECEKDTKQFQVMNINKWMGQILVYACIIKGNRFSWKNPIPPRHAFSSYIMQFASLYQFLKLYGFFVIYGRKFGSNVARKICGKESLGRSRLFTVPTTLSTLQIQGNKVDLCDQFD